MQIDNFRENGLEYFDVILSGAESKDPAAVLNANATGFLDLARNDCDKAADESADHHRSLHTR
jgi:hypothetical protein